MSEAQKITAALGGHWYGHYGTAPCPVCQKEARREQNALTIAQGDRLLMNCKKSRCAFSDILAASGHPRIRRDEAEPGTPGASVNYDQTKSTRALDIWDRSQGVEGTIAETYLRVARKIWGPLPPALRFNKNLWHSPTQQVRPALVAKLESGSGFGVLRTYLKEDGSNKADVKGEHQKMRLGRAVGGHVPITNGSGPLTITEGIESALSFAELFDLPNQRVWAALGAGNMPRIKLPESPGRLIVAPDGDAAGRTNAQALAERASSLGWRVEIFPAPEGQDWNDVLMAMRS